MIEVVLFISGAALMALELTASRILSPYIGSSIFVWTAIIGIIMASLSAGYYQGGKLSNKKLQVSILSNLFFLTGLSIFLTYLIKELSLYWIVGTFRDTRISAGVAALILFAPASFLFGMITPYATRLKLHNLDKSGEVVGKLYAISTLGSIFGTFSTGYFLLGFFGSGKILLALGAIMVIASAIVDNKNFFKVKKIITLLFFCVLVVTYKNNESSAIIYESDSNYQKIYVLDSKERSTKRPTRLLRMSILAHSGRYLDGDDLMFEYIRQLTLVNHFKPGADNILFIGGGGYSLPSYMVNRNTNLKVDVVELDPQVTKVANKYFNVPQTERIKSYNIDGRSYINKSKEKYDVIVLDAYRDEYVMPFELTTTEAVQKYWDLLEDDGVLAINIISALTGPKSKFLSSEIATLKKRFPKVLLYQTAPGKRSENMQNVEVFAFKKDSDVKLSSDDPNFQELLNYRWEGDLQTDLDVLTDDYAPIERLMLAAF